MYECKDCKPPYQRPTDHEGDRRRVKSCNWLDGMVDDAGGKCPHCDGPVVHFMPAPAGAILDELSRG